MSQNVFNPAVLVLYLWPTVSWVALFSLIWNMRSWNAAVFTPERYRVLLCDFYPGLIQPRAALQRHSTLPREAFGGFVFFFFSSAPQFTVLFSHQLFPVWKEAFHVCFGPGGVWPPNRMSCYGWEKARLPPLEFIPTASVRTLDSISPATSPFIFISSFLSLLFTFLVLSSLPDLRLLQYS